MQTSVLSRRLPEPDLARKPARGDDYTTAVDDTERCRGVGKLPWLGVCRIVPPRALRRTPGGTRRETIPCFQGDSTWSRGLVCVSACRRFWQLSRTYCPPGPSSPTQSRLSERLPRRPPKIRSRSVDRRRKRPPATSEGSRDDGVRRRRY